MLSYLKPIFSLLFVLIIWNFFIIGNSIIYYISSGIVVISLFGFVYTYFESLLVKRGKEKEKLINERFKSQSEEIESIYKDFFDKKGYKKYFDKDIFNILNMTLELNDEVLNGQMKMKTVNLINNSLKLYIVNVKTSMRIIKAKNFNLDVDDQLNILLSQNVFITEQLRTFLGKLILIDITDKKYDELKKEFEYNLTNIESIKKIRSTNA
jgi:hypothetical protein